MAPDGPGLRGRQPRRDLARLPGREIHAHELRSSVSTSDGDRPRAVGRRIRIARVGAAREARTLPPSRLHGTGPSGACRPPRARGARRAPRGRRASSADRTPRIRWRAAASSPACAAAGASGRSAISFGIALELGVLAAARRLRLALGGRRLDLPDGEAALAARGIPAHEQPASVRRHLRRQRAAGQALPELSLDQPGLLQALLLRERAGRQLGAEPVVERLRRFAEDPLERLGEAAAARGGHPFPQLRQRLPAVPVGEPLEIRRADEVRDRAAEPARRAVELAVVGQPALDRELSQHHRAEARAGPARAGSAPLRRWSRSPRSPIPATRKRAGRTAPERAARGRPRSGCAGARGGRCARSRAWPPAPSSRRSRRSRIPTRVPRSTAGSPAGRGTERRCRWRPRRDRRPRPRSAGPGRSRRSRSPARGSLRSLPRRGSPRPRTAPGSGSGSAPSRPSASRPPAPARGRRRTRQKEGLRDRPGAWREGYQRGAETFLPPVRLPLEMEDP